MNTKTLSNSFLIVTALAAILLAFSMNASRVRAASIFDITFPIPELGNCADKDACKAYCADEANQSACQEFAANHGITPPAGGSQDQKLQALQKDGGPGNCAAGAKDPQDACKAYCDSTNHIDECVAYGKNHGLLSGDQLAQAEKVSAALKGGAKLPDGCTDQNSCKAVCENPSSIDQAKSCFAFGKAAGLLPPGFDEAQAEKVFQSIQDGIAPFKNPKDFQQCEHPADAATLQKCVDFGVKSGMLSQEQADVIKKTGGKGPGGCEGKDACDAYCSAHQQECFQFSKDNGLVTPEQEQQMQQGAAQFKQGLDQAPASVKTCIVAAIGQSTLNAITSASTMPDPSIGEKMRSCFDQGQQNQGGQGSGDNQGDNQFGSPQNGQNGPEQMGPPPGESGRFMPPPPGGYGSSSQMMWQGNRGEDMRGGPNGGSPSQGEPPQGPQQFPANMPPNQQGQDQHWGPNQQNWQSSDQRQMPPGMNGSQYGNGSPGQPMPPPPSQGDQMQPSGDSGQPQMMQPPPPGGMPQGMQEQGGSGTMPSPSSGNTSAPPPPPPPPSSPTSLLNSLKQSASALANVFSAIFWRRSD